MVDESVSGFDPDRKPVNEDELRLVLQISIQSTFVIKGKLFSKVERNKHCSIRQGFKSIELNKYVVICKVSLLIQIIVKSYF